MSPDYYSHLLKIMAEDNNMSWGDIKQIMYYLKDHVKFEDEADD